MPPNSKGGAFIHDPKLAGEREVYAQIKLFFHSANSMKMISTRSMQLTVKKNTRTFKTLEGNLVVIKDGHRQNVSTRCAELESMMPLYLGASRAIIDNVIFCHQEESLWPLSEPAALKKKFDEIFEAQKFTKALDNIKNLRKEYLAEIKLLEQKTDYLKADRDKARLLEADAERISKQIEEHNVQVEKMASDLNIITKELEQLISTKQGFRDVLYELDYLRRDVESDASNIANLRQTIELLPSSESELREEIENFGSKMNERKEKVNEIQQSVQGKKDELSRTRRHYNENILKAAQFQADYDNYLVMASERDKTVFEMCKNLDIPSGIKERVMAAELKAKGRKGVQIDPADYEEFFEILEHLRERYRHELEAQKRNNSLIEHQHEQKVQEVTTERLRHETTLFNLEKDVRQATEQIAGLKRTIGGISVNEADVEYENSQLADIEKAIKEANDLVDKIGSGGAIQEKEAKLKIIASEMEKLNEELRIVNDESDNRAKLGVLTEDLGKRMNAHLALVEAKKADFEKLGINIGESTDSSFLSGNVEQNLRQSIEECQKEYDQATHHLDSIRREHSLAESRLGMNTQNLQALVKEKETLREKIYSEIDFDHKEYASQIADLEAEEAELNAEIGQTNFFKSLHQRAITDAENHNRCLMCYREFQVVEEKDGFLQIINEKEERIQNVEKLKTTYEQVVEAIKVLRSIAPSIDRLNTLETNLLPFEEKRKPELEKDVKEKKDTFEAAQADLQKKKEELENMESLRRPAADLSRNINELSNIKTQIATTKAQLRNYEDKEGEILSSSQILVQLGHKTEESQVVRKELDKLIDARDQARTKIATLQVTRTEKIQRIGEMKKQLEVKTDAEGKITELDADRISHNKDITKEKQILEDITRQLQRYEKERNNIKIEGAERESKVSIKFGSVSEAVGDLERLTAVVVRYETSGGKEKLDSTQILISTLEEQIERVEKEIEEIDKELKEAEKALLDLSAHERLLKDNLKLKEMQIDIEAKRERIAELEEMNADAERIKFEEQIAFIRQEEAKVASNRAGIYGEMKQLDDQLRNVTTQLERDYKTTTEDYRKELLTLQARILINDDLAKYAKALDSSIMSYHSTKMEEINRIIDDLWKKTYSGTDVDTILIKSENETSRGGRMYNYRVCMVKSDVELDMRGRCSAGQKVLASIIIRLALAECFGTNCGLIALDEPTTNLDEDNIESLAKALSQIISTRRAQKNFQLIVITHDEKFLAHMNASAYTDCFYRVSRNERQLSQIEWVPISRIAE